MSSQLPEGTFSQNSPENERDVLTNPAKELLTGSSDRVGLWIRKALSPDVIPLEEMATPEAAIQINNCYARIAREMGIEVIEFGDGLPPYVNYPSIDVIGEVRLKAGPEIQKIIEGDPVARAAAELGSFFLDVAESGQGYVYDVLIELSRWAAAQESGHGYVSLESGNDAVRSSFLGQLEIFLAGKGLSGTFSY